MNPGLNRLGFMEVGKFYIVLNRDAPTVTACDFLNPRFPTDPQLTRIFQLPSFSGLQTRTFRSCRFYLSWPAKAQRFRLSLGIFPAWYRPYFAPQDFQAHWASTDSQPWVGLPVFPPDRGQKGPTVQIVELSPVEAPLRATNCGQSALTVFPVQRALWASQSWAV